MVEVTTNLIINLIITILFVIRRIKGWFIDLNINCAKPNWLEKRDIPFKAQQISKSLKLLLSYLLSSLLLVTYIRMLIHQNKIFK